MSVPTIYDVARHAGVGIATVSRVVNGEKKVRDETRAKVLEAVKVLGYRPNRAARRLAGGGNNRPRVAVLLPFFTASFYFQMSRAIARGLAQESVDLILYDVTSREHKNRILDRVVTERGAEGIILVSIGIGHERVKQLDRLGIAAVSVDRVVAGLPSVTVDNVAGGEMAARHLQAAGARRVGLISGPKQALALRQRERAFDTVFGADAPRWRAGSVEAAAGQVAMAELIGFAPDLDGVVCVNDLLAVGALQELKRSGYAVPGDVQVIGFDDQPMMEILELTTVRQPVARMGNWAVRHLVQAMGSMERADSEVLPLQVVSRSTTNSTARE